jgi:hypothetical protein
MSGNGKPKNEILFAVIQQRGDPYKAITLDGQTVVREEKVFIPEYQNFVACAPYSSHFVYLDPSGIEQRWFAMCTCGSPAVIVGYDAYRQDASSNEGAMLVCLFHAQRGHHANEQGSQWT